MIFTEWQHSLGKENDMGRLVDIEDVKALINGLDSLPWEEEVEDLIKTIPTAFDKEKVVQQLEELERKSTTIIGQHYFDNGVHASIEIVKAGGIDG